MFQLTSKSTYQVTGRGTVFAVDCPIEATRQNLFVLLGPRVEIDGAVYNVAGIEAYAVQRPIRVGEPIGILVTPQSTS